MENSKKLLNKTMNLSEIDLNDLIAFYANNCCSTDISWQDLMILYKANSYTRHELLSINNSGQTESFSSISTNMKKLEDTSIKMNDSKESRNEKKIKPKKEEKSTETETRFSGKYLIIIL